MTNLTVSWYTQLDSARSVLVSEINAIPKRQLVGHAIETVAATEQIKSARGRNGAIDI
jgi:hypothetical protein